MNKIEMQQIIKMVKRTCVQPREFPPHAAPHEVSQHIFAQQGVQSVIRVLQAIQNGQLKPDDFDEESPED